MKKIIDTYKNFDDANNRMIECREMEAQSKDDFISTCEFTGNVDEIEQYIDKEYTIEVVCDEFQVVEFDN